MVKKSLIHCGVLVFIMVMPVFLFSVNVQAGKVYNSDTAGLKVSYYTEPSPPKIGSNVLRIILKDKKGKLIKNAEIEISTVMPLMPDMGNSKAKAVLTKANEYAVPFTIGMNGDWKITIKIKMPDKKTIETYYNFTTK